MEAVIDVEQEELEKAEQYFERALEMFPDVDVDFLQRHCIQFALDQEGFNRFLEDTMLENKYPKMQTSDPPVLNDDNNNENNFSIEKFVEKFPDPEKYFSSSENGLKYVTHSLVFLMDRFRLCRASKIRAVLKRNNFNLFKTYKELKTVEDLRVHPRRQSEIVGCPGKPPSEYYDEIHFIINEDIILGFLRDKEIARQAAITEARNAGALLSCGCCYADDLLAEDVVTCTEGHIFCKNCVTKSTQVLMGDGKIDFPCLQDCGEFFDVTTLKGLMAKETYEKLLKKLQEREVVQAGIPGLESCPFCEYSVIPDEASRIFECLSCKKLSCRLCKRESHIPLTCQEAMNSDTTKERTYVEERMSEALIRNCYKCGSKFIREDGCNKMKCHCGAIMCYICRKPIKDYSHFQERAVSGSGKCPLWTNNNHLHNKEVKREAERAIDEVRRNNPGINLDLFKKIRK